MHTYLLYLLHNLFYTHQIPQLMNLLDPYQPDQTYLYFSYIWTFSPFCFKHRFCLFLLKTSYEVCFWTNIEERMNGFKKKIKDEDESNIVDKTHAIRLDGCWSKPTHSIMNFSPFFASNFFFFHNIHFFSIAKILLLLL